MGKTEQRVGLVRDYGRKIIGSRNSYCHQMVAEVAQAMCGSIYDELAHRYNEFHSINPSREKYVASSWGLYVASARETLVEMLGRPATPEEQKEDIYEAICLDKQLARDGADHGIQVRFH